MNDETQKENRPSLDRNAFLAEIERLYVEGYPTREIAQLLGEDGNKVGRNLRELSAAGPAPRPGSKPSSARPSAPPSTARP